MKHIKSLDGFVVCDPDGNLDHTSIRLNIEEAIEEFLAMEGMIDEFAIIIRTAQGKEVHRPSKTWEEYAIAGYSVIPVTITARNYSPCLPS